MNTTSATLIRSILKVGAGYFVSKGVMDDATGEVIIAGIIGLVAVIWGVIEKKKLTKPTEEKP